MVRRLPCQTTQLPWSFTAAAAKSGLDQTERWRGLLPTVLDVVENPKNLKIVGWKHRSCLALWTTRKSLWQLQYHLCQPDWPDSGERRYLCRDKDSPYVNLIVTREDNKDAGT